MHTKGTIYTFLTDITWDLNSRQIYLNSDLYQLGIFKL